jgi:Flp pilus assembly protein TadG
VPIATVKGVQHTTLSEVVTGAAEVKLRSEWYRGRLAATERGAALVEFALILPLFMTLILGMVSGGIAYNQKLSMTNAAREAARYGATLPVGSFTGTDQLTQWLDSVATTAVSASTSQVPTSAPGRVICVAYVSPGAVAEKDITRSRSVTGTGTPAYANSQCYSDGRPATERRVQVVIQREGEIELLIQRFTPTLRAESTARFEPAAAT